MTKTANHHTPDLNQENSMSHIPQNSLQEKLARNAKLGLSKALAGVALAGSVGVPAQAIASEGDKSDTTEKVIIAPEKANYFTNTYKVTAEDIKQAVSDTLQGKKLTDLEKQMVIEDFKKTLSINADTLNIGDVRVGDPHILDISTGKKITGNQVPSSAKVAHVQDYYLKATMHPQADQKYADILKEMQLKFTLSKLMMDNRIDQKVNSFGVSSLNKDYMIGLDPTNTNKISVNALMAFDVNGASHEASRSKDITLIYDRETTKEKVKNAIEQLPFTLKFDANVLKKGIPGYMSHIDLNKLLRQGLKWSQEAILSDNQATDNDLQNWTRKLMLGAEELVDIGVTYDDQKVAIKINTPEAKDGIIMHKVLGFDLAFKIITHGNQVKLEIPNEGKNGLEAFKEHVILAFTQLWDKINATDFGDEKQYPNLKKVPTKEGNLMGYKVSPRITTISLYPVVAFNINFGSTEQPFNVICVMEQRDGQSLELKFIDEFGRTRESNTIQKDAKSSLSMGTADGGFKIGEFRGTDQPYTGINYEGPKAGLLSKALKTYNPSTRELVHRDPKTLKTLARMKTEVSDQGTSKAKEVGYRYDSKNKTVQITSDHFSHVLHFAQGHNEPSVLEKGVALGISETQISAKFKELFDKTFEGKKQLPGIIVDGRYATVDTKNDDKTTIVKEHLPDEVLAIITALHNYLDGVAKLHTMKVEVSVDGRGKSGKENRNVFASIAGEQGVGKTPVKGIDTFDHSQKLNPAIYTLITGKGNKAEIDFNIRNNSDVLLISDKVDMDGTEYTLKYDSRNNTLYLIPPKK